MISFIYYIQNTRIKKEEKTEVKKKLGRNAMNILFYFLPSVFASSHPFLFSCFVTSLFTSFQLFLPLLLPSSSLPPLLSPSLAPHFLINFAHYLPYSSLSYFLCFMLLYILTSFPCPSLLLSLLIYFLPVVPT